MIGLKTTEVHIISGMQFHDRQYRLVHVFPLFFFFPNFLYKLLVCHSKYYCFVLKVYPGGWTAVLISLDNPGAWNIRSENLDRWYLGQETYMRIVNPEENGESEMGPPDNVLYCGALASLQKYVLLPSLPFS